MCVYLCVGSVYLYLFFTNTAVCGYPVCMSFGGAKSHLYGPVSAFSFQLCVQHATMPHRVFSDKLWKLEIQNVLKKPI